MFARALVLGSSLLFVVTPAFADDGAVDACSAAAVSGQKLRRAGKLRDAASWFEVCARPTCREDIASDCRKWQNDIGARLPSIVVRSQDENGQPATDVRVVIDGALVPTESLAQAITLDPGPHTVDFERHDAPRVSRSVTLAEGDHVDVTVTLPAPALRVIAAPRIDESGERKGIPTPALVSGIVATVGLVTFGTLAAVGYGDWRGSKCDVGCAHADATRVKTTLLAADISLAVTAVAGGLATFFYFHGRSARN